MATTNILQLTRLLTLRPEPAASPIFRLRHYQGHPDIGTWLELRRATFAREAVGVRQWEERDFEAEFLARWWWRPERMWLAEPVTSGAPAVSTVPEPALVGAVTLAFRGHGPDARPVVHWLCVHPRWRRRGLGRALVAALETDCWDLGYRQLWLETHSAWRAAIKLYRALGYEEAT